MDTTFRPGGGWARKGSCHALGRCRRCSRARKPRGLTLAGQACHVMQRLRRHGLSLSRRNSRSGRGRPLDRRQRRSGGHGSLVRIVLMLRCESQRLKNEGMIGLSHADVGVVDEPPVGDNPLNSLASQERASESARPGKALRGRRSDRAAASIFPGRSRHRPPTGLSGRRGRCKEAVDHAVCGTTTAP
jgi:hypothetical protein